MRRCFKSSCHDSPHGSCWHVFWILVFLSWVCGCPTYTYCSTKFGLTHKCLFGDTSDISHFRFPFWHPIWHYPPHIGFTHLQMLPERFLGITCNTGNDFCYFTLTKPTNSSTATFLTWNGIQMWYPWDRPPVVAAQLGEPILVLQEWQCNASWICNKFCQRR